MPERIYFDNAATTAPDPQVREAMWPYLGEFWGNPSSLYAEGRQAREAVERARAGVASLLGAEPDEMVFTGSGTEADNLALQGALL
ncbi:MAG: aminotransferase class V-fold PLP-dependent enzyme, partial [Thermoguttaceae bacterium]